MNLTKKRLEAYRSNERLIQRNKEKIEDEKAKDIPVVYGKVRSSMSEHPYIETHMAVQMDEPTEADRSFRRIQMWENEISEARRSNEEVERFINEIEDAKAKEIFTYRYIDGRKIKNIAKDVGYTPSRVSQIISNFLKD